MDSILCAIGLHKWKNQRTIEWKQEFSVVFFTGDVCQRCGKHKHDPIKVTEGLPQDYEVLGPINRKGEVI